MTKPVKIILALAIIVIVATLGFTLWLQETQPNGQLPNGNQTDTSNWKTYKNGELGFEVRYPIDWEITERAEGRLFAENGPIGRTVGLMSPEKNKYGSPYWIHIYVVDNVDYSSVLEYFQFAHRGDRVIIKNTDLVILGSNDDKFLKIESNIFYYYVIIKNHKYFEIDGGDSGVENINKETEQIISTFRFIK